jgi:hypothetical protein
MNRSLTNLQVSHFHDEGYLIVPDLFDPADLQPLRRELEERIDAVIERLHGQGRLNDTHRGEPFEKRAASIYNDSRENGQAIIDELAGDGGGRHTGLEMFKFICHPKLLAAMESLVGPEIVGSSVYRLRPKFPGLERGVVPWHQDSGYFSQLCDRHLIVTCWIPFVDADEHNGCMKILPRAHKMEHVFTHHSGGKAGYLVIQDNDLPAGMPKPIPAVCPLGGAVLMTNLTPHCSTPNYSDGIRWSVDLRYPGADAPNNVGLWPDPEQPGEEVTMACYPPEADFIVQSRAHPQSRTTYEDYVARRRRFEAIKNRKTVRPWQPVGAPVSTIQ